MRWRITGVYILELEDDKYYVGYSTNIYARLRKHFIGATVFDEIDEFHTPNFIEEHPPKRVMGIIRTAELTEMDVDMETAITVQMMEKYGASNVRGGKLIQESISINSSLLPVEVREELARERAPSW